MENVAVPLVIWGKNVYNSVLMENMEWIATNDVSAKMMANVALWPENVRALEDGQGHCTYAIPFNSAIRSSDKL